MSLNNSNVSLAIMILIALVSMGLVVYSVVTKTTTPDVVNTLLGVVLGYLGSHLSSAQGANQAMSVPPTQEPTTQI